MAAEKKAKKKASKPAGPSCFVKVCEAIKAKKGTFGKGVSRSFIYKHIGDNHSGTSVAAVRRAISKAVADGLLEAGATKQRFKMTEAGKKKMAPPKPKKKKKKKKAAKKKKASKKKRKKTVKRKSSKKKKAKKRTSKRKSAKRKSAKRRPAKRSPKKKTKKRTSKKRRAAAKK